MINLNLFKTSTLLNDSFTTFNLLLNFVKIKTQPPFVEAGPGFIKILKKMGGNNLCYLPHWCCLSCDPLKLLLFLFCDGIRIQFRKENRIFTNLRNNEIQVWVKRRTRPKYQWWVWAEISQTKQRAWKQKAIGGFQLLDLIIMELKSHITC